MTKALIDEDLWIRIEPLLPKHRRRDRRYAGRRPIPDRAVLTGILFVLRNGIPWNMLPREMGCGSGTTLLAALGAVATGRCLEAVAHRVAQRTTSAGPTRSGSSDRRQLVAPRAARGKKTGLNP